MLYIRPVIRILQMYMYAQDGYVYLQMYMYIFAKYFPLTLYQEISDVALCFLFAEWKCNKMVHSKIAEWEGKKIFVC